jgi:hypothetical protein
MVVGGALAQISKANPILAFVMGFLSHYILDIIPHWDYPLLSSSKSKTGNPLDGEIVIGRGFLVDLVKVGADFLIGLSIVLFFFEPNGFSILLNPLALIKSPILWGSFGGILPDILQFIYYKTKREPLTSFQKFHDFMHSRMRLNNHMIMGPALQIIFVALVIYLITLFH